MRGSVRRDLLPVAVRPGPCPGGGVVARYYCTIRWSAAWSRRPIPMNGARMPKPRPPAGGARTVPKTYRLDPDKLAAAQRILGTATATETIELALELVVLRRELMDGTRNPPGLVIAPPGAR